MVLWKFGYGSVAYQNVSKFLIKRLQRFTLRNCDDYKLPCVKDKNTFKFDSYQCFNDLPLDLRKGINNNTFISGAKTFLINKALARLS